MADDSVIDIASSTASTILLPRRLIHGDRHRVSRLELPTCRHKLVTADATLYLMMIQRSKALPSHYSLRLAGANLGKLFMAAAYPPLSL